MSDINEKDWKRTAVDVFWSEIAPCEHVLQVYETDEIFLDALTGFVGNGINEGDCVIVIATQAHLDALKKRLAEYGVKVPMLISEERYIPMNAEEVLARFMVNGWPDEQYFYETVLQIIAPAQHKKQTIRVFGEMVALLWAQGNHTATVTLEKLWNEFCNKTSLSIFCAYPKSGFTQNLQHAINSIYCAHSKMIAGSEKQLREVYYHDVANKTA